MRVFCVSALLLVAASLLAGSEEEGRRLFKEGQKAERAGDIVRAYVLYSQAVAQDPYNLDYWLRSQALRARATLRTKPAPPGAEAPKTARDTPAPAESISDEELAQARRPQPPQELKASGERRSLDLRGDARSLFTQVARAYGLEAVFDSDYPPGTPLRFRLDNADYREGLRALEATTASFVAPVGERRFLVVKDTPQKRAEIEPLVSVAIPVPEPVTLQEAQELTRGVQQAMGLVRLAFDSQRRIVLIRDRVSKVRPAQELLEQLLRYPALVSIEVEFVEENRSSSASYGASLQTLFPLVDFGRPWAASTLKGLTRFAAFGGGMTLLGVGIADAQVFTRMSRATGGNLFRTEIRSLDGQAASIHVGDRYPVITGQYVSAGGSNAANAQPTISYEELGLIIKITPRVNGVQEMTLDLEAEFKALTGQEFNNVPVVANRKLQSEVSLRNGEWAVIAGLMNSSQARTISGLAGLSRVPLLGPLLRTNTRDESQTQVLVLIKPTLLSLPPGEAVTRPVWVGAEQHPRSPL